MDRLDDAVCARALEAARMVATEGLGEGRPAHGFIIIVGDTKEILADERRDEERRDIKLCRYGNFKTYLDRRIEDLSIGDCLSDGKRSFLNLFQEDGAIVVDGQTGQVCCGGFFVNDLSSGIGTGGARTKAASAMATHAGGCYVLLASETVCGSASRPLPAEAELQVFKCSTRSRPVPLPIRAHQAERTSQRTSRGTSGRNTTIQYNFGGAQMSGVQFLGSTEGGDANFYAK